MDPTCAAVFAARGPIRADRGRAPVARGADARVGVHRGGVAPSLTELGEIRGVVDKSTVSRYLTIGEAFPPEAAIRAGVTEEDMATLSLPALPRAAKKPEAQGFTLQRDVLRKRRRWPRCRPARAARRHRARCPSAMNAAR
jgi:hypothetical protein